MFERKTFPAVTNLLLNQVAMQSEFRPQLNNVGVRTV